MLLETTAVLLAAALVVTWSWRARNRRTVGRVLHSVKRRRRARAVVLGVSGAASGVAIIASGGALQPVEFGVLGLALAVIATSPGFQDSVYGESGVQYGWYARRYEELEAWRLIGEHLRWRLAGLWVATDVPSMMHSELRARLEQTCPARESGHGNAGLDPQRASSSMVQSADGG
jgi:hypothetical protein